ncbi:unnamed protein product [Arabis nemorensis]|uniref:Uncharacterized protein n=1 Tax=Arabis nemorensis TaxID=586526 RepID=A0A565C9T4_9BRAS|nr:unnamed protein product [Arabis nemorensis]
MRLATELEERRRQRTLREIEKRELEEAQALLEDTEKRQRKGKNIIVVDAFSPNVGEGIATKVGEGH